MRGRLATITEHVARVAKVSEALRAYPPILDERVLGGQKRDMGTLVDLLAKADDSTFPLFQPTRALVGRTLVMAELNLWRLLRHICGEAEAAGAEVASTPVSSSPNTVTPINRPIRVIPCLPMCSTASSS